MSEQSRPLDRSETWRGSVQAEAFLKLTADERQLLTCALAGNFPEHLSHLRWGLIRALAEADLQAAKS